MAGPTREGHDAVDILFEVRTPSGFDVHVARRQWDMIVTFKHPVMTGQEGNVRETLSNPDEVRRSRTDQDVYLFYRALHTGRWTCAVCKQVSLQEGFLITAYPADAIKEGDLIWPK